MKPETQLTNSPPERALISHEVDGVERDLGSDKKSGIKSGAERYEQSSENNAVISDIGFTATLPAPIKNDPMVGSSVVVDDTPSLAADDDLIEKEWVDKAKKIISDTHDNPHSQEEAVSKLQIDYLKKRYGREIGAAE